MIYLKMGIKPLGCRSIWRIYKKISLSVIFVCFYHAESICSGKMDFVFDIVYGSNSLCERFGIPSGGYAFAVFAVFEQS